MADTQTKTSVKSTKKKVYKNIAEGKLFVQSTFNNTIVTITDMKGATLSWSSSGHAGFKGARKSTPYAATTALEKALEAAKPYGIKKLEVYLKGPGVGRDATLRLLRSKREYDVDVISDVTPIAHNGPRPPKVRRV